MTREAARADFLTQAGWAQAQSTALAGDASTRRYHRLRRSTGESAILMDADPLTGQDTRPFVTIARHLTGLGLAAPEILHWDAEAGFLLLEDFGDAMVSRVTASDPEQEARLYDVATDVLIALHQHPPPAEAPGFSTAAFGAFTDLAVTWYAGGADPEPLTQAVTAALRTLPEAPPVLALRDYHAENLVWRGNRSGLQRMGLLDFQDAMVCHPAYDVISLTEDARREVSPDRRAAVIARYLAGTDHEAEAFHRACHIWGAQRNLRILGIFARLSLAFGKPSYVDLIPRTWAHVMRDLDHPDLSDLKTVVLDLLPEPTPDRLARLKEEAGQWPMQ